VTTQNVQFHNKTVQRTHNSIRISEQMVIPSK